MRKTKIYYFSGTGNSLAAAKQLAEEIPADIIPITKELTEAKPHIECESCVLIFPAYAYGLPPLVRKFLSSADFKCGYFAALGTCGTTCGGAFSVIKRKLQSKGQKLDYAQEIQTVENYVHMFGFPKAAEIAARVDLQRTQTKIAAEMLKIQGKNKTGSLSPLSDFISLMFRSAKWMFARSYRVQDSCTGCGLCARVCSAAAIELKDGKPCFNARTCNHCQSCLNLCPNKSIKYMRIKPDSQRYIHPDIETDELTKR